MSNHSQRSQLIITLVFIALGVIFVSGIDLFSQVHQTNSNVLCSGSSHINVPAVCLAALAKVCQNLFILPWLLLKKYLI